MGEIFECEKCGHEAPWPDVDTILSLVLTEASVVEEHVRDTLKKGEGGGRKFLIDFFNRALGKFESGKSIVEVVAKGTIEGKDLKTVLTCHSGGKKDEN